MLGDGDGRFTARLLQENDAINVTAIDASPAMLEALKRRTSAYVSRVTMHVMDARRMRSFASDQGPEGVTGQVVSYDLVVSHFFLDCLTTEEVRSLVAAVRPNLGKGAFWVVSEFAVPDSWLGRLVFKPLIAALYGGFAVLTGLAVCQLPDHGSALREAGMILTERRPHLNGLLVSELWRAD